MTVCLYCVIAPCFFYVAGYEIVIFDEETFWEIYVAIVVLEVYESVSEGYGNGIDDHENEIS